MYYAIKNSKFLQNKAVYLWISTTFVPTNLNGPMTILIIEDERELSRNIAKYMSADHYLCEQAFSFEEAVERISLYNYDCILLDLSLPGGDGLKILEQIQSQGIDSSVIIISARGSLQDRITGMKTGADDYLAKPFPLSELSVRIYAQMRRRYFSGTNILKTGELEINMSSKTVSVNGCSATLTKSEYELLLYLVGNRGKVVSKNAIAEHLSGDAADILDSHNFVYAHIKNLKSKLEEAGCSKCSIKTTYGTGYQWVE